MNRKLLTALAVVLLIAGLTMLIAPRISNRVGEQIAHTTIAELMTEKRALEKELESYQGFGKTSEPESKLNEISHITEIIENQPLQFDDNLIRQMLECVVVQSKEQIKIVFKDGTEVDQPLS